MTRAVLPRAYLRMSPNLDQHPDPGGMVLLLCAANRQPTRGQFRDREVLVRTLGNARFKRFLERGDVLLISGIYLVDGWQEWQEGDLTVGERQARIRDKRAEKSQPSNGYVTPPALPERDSPSEAIGEGRKTYEEAKRDRLGNEARADGPVEPLVTA